MRQASQSRKTRETHVELDLNLDGKGVFEINTGIGFFNHMLETFSKHSLIDLNVNGSGDIHVDFHHLVEDTGITLGFALHQALGDMKGIRRFGWAVVPLDEALAEAVIDFSGRPYFETNLLGCGLLGKIGEFDYELGEVFFAGIASTGLTLHINVKNGHNRHHVLEASVKAFAHALRQAVEFDPRTKGVIPSTKGFIQVRDL